MSVVWVLLVSASVVAAAWAGKMSALTSAITTSAQAAATLSLGLIGILTLWLGLMRVAEEAGLVAMLSRAARPVLTRLFPDVPADHPAMGAMVMNVAANLLGLGNAATPFGIEAMRRLDDLNPHRGTATDAQALLCALNTASLQVIPATVIALRTAAGAEHPGNIIGPTLLATSCAAAAAVISAKLLARFFPRPAPAPGDCGAGAVPGDVGHVDLPGDVGLAPDNAGHADTSADENGPASARNVNRGSDRSVPGERRRRVNGARVNDAQDGRGAGSRNPGSGGVAR